MRDDRFEWDDRKAAANLKKHKVSFEEARFVFDDHLAVEQLDDREDYDEDRFVTTGRSDGRLLTVGYTWRHDRRRLITARRATRREQDEYFTQAGQS
jgi:hypothetical protein